MHKSLLVTFLILVLASHARAADDVVAQLRRCLGESGAAVLAGGNLLEHIATLEELRTWDTHVREQTACFDPTFAALRSETAGAINQRRFRQCMTHRSFDNMVEAAKNATADARTRMNGADLAAARFALRKAYLEQGRLYAVVESCLASARASAELTNCVAKGREDLRHGREAVRAFEAEPSGKGTLQLLLVALVNIDQTESCITERAEEMTAYEARPEDGCVGDTRQIARAFKAARGRVDRFFDEALASKRMAPREVISAVDNLYSTFETALKRYETCFGMQ